MNGCEEPDLVSLGESRWRWPRISIVTPSYNQADTLEATMLSVLGQDYPDLEYTVLDGGSDDGSREIIERYVGRLAFWRSSPDGGQYQAIDEGLRRSSGEVMMWLNADDMLHPRSLWTIGEIFATFPQVEWLMGNPSFFDAQGRTFHVGDAHRWSRYRHLRGHLDFIQQESVAWRRSLWDRAGGRLDTAYSYAADFELWTRFFRYSQMYTTPALIGGFRVRRSGQRSREHMEEYLEECKAIIASELASTNVGKDDRRALRRIGLFERSVMAIPVLRSSAKVRLFHGRLLRYPPLVVYRDSAFRLEDASGRSKEA